MFEMLISPRHAEQKPQRLFFVGLLYVALSFLIVNLIFLRDPVLSKHSSLLVITFTVIFSMPFIHSLIRIEEIREMTEGKSKALFKPHFQAISALLFLFLGFLAAFTILYIVLPEKIVLNNFQSQIEQFCRVNYQNLDECLKQYGMSSITGKAVETNSDLMNIFINNIYVLIFILVFSLTFGGGDIHTCVECFGNCRCNRDIYRSFLPAPSSRADEVSCSWDSRDIRIFCCRISRRNIKHSNNTS